MSSSPPAEVSEFLEQLEEGDWESVASKLSECHRIADSGPASAREQLCRDGWIKVVGSMIVGTGFPNGSLENEPKIVDFLKTKVNVHAC
jgi:hypothetical protein